MQTKKAIKWRLSAREEEIVKELSKNEGINL